MERVRFGVIGTGNIGQAKVIPAMQRGERCTIAAIASRDLAKAEGVAARLGIPRAYGSYDDLLRDRSIEAVYITLPNHLHVPLAIEAAKAGKHVLCEKPIALTAAEAEELRAFEGEVLVAEAFMVRHHPQWLRARELVQSGRVGALRAVQVFFSYYNVDPRNVRNQADIGGGALYDVGCYAVVSGRFPFGAEPRRAIALVDRDPALRTDRTTSALLDFGEGRQLTFTVSTQCVPFQRVQLVGTKGRVELQIPFNAPSDAATRIFIDDGTRLDGGAIATESFPACDQYTLQGDTFARAVRGELKLPHGLDDAVANMRVIDALFRSEKSERWEEI